MEKMIVQYVGEPRFFPNRKDPIIARFEKVIGHPTLGDRESVTTSKIVSIANDGVIETLNTIYRPVQQ